MEFFQLLLARERARRMGEHRLAPPPERAAVLQMHDHGLRRQRVGIGRAVVARLDTRRQVIGLGIGQRLAAEMREVERTVLQGLGDGVGHAEARVAGASVGSRRPADQAHDQRRGDHFDAGDIGGGESVFGAQHAHALDAAMGRASGGKWLVAEFGQAPLAAEAGEHRLEVVGALEQRQVAVGPLEHPMRRREAERRQLAGLQRGAGVEGDLHGQDRAALGVRLHGAAHLRQLPGEGRFEGRAVEAEQAARGRHRAETAGSAGAEEAKARPRGEAEAGGDVDADRKRCDQLGAARAAPQFGRRQRGRQDGGHGMHHRTLVQAVVFLVVHLPGIEKGGGGCGEPRTATPHRHGAVCGPTAPAGRHPEQPLAALDRGAGDADAQTVEHEDLGALDHGSRQVCEARAEHMVGKAGGGGHCRHSLSFRRTGSARHLGPSQSGPQQAWPA